MIKKDNNIKVVDQKKEKLHPLVSFSLYVPQSKKCVNNRLLIKSNLI